MELIRRRPAGAPRLRMEEPLRTRLRLATGTWYVVEIGGTAGEKEHSAAIEALMGAAGPPAAHVHLTSVVDLGGRLTTKPAQLCLEQLPVRPTAVLFRAPAGSEGPPVQAALQKLQDFLPPQPFVPVGLVEESCFPERAMHA